jgi:uncharacterized protein (TIGR01777 family)
MAGMRVAVTGASGLIGTALTTHLRTRGDEVVSFVRRRPRSPAERPWEPTPGGMDPAHLADIDAVVHLAGAGVGAKRWTAAYKKKILHSRVDGTTAVAEAIAAADRPIRLVSGSAVGFYGDRGDELLDESSAPGIGFLADVVRAWESATAAAAESGAPVACIRTGLVMAQDGGAFEQLVTLARLGLGGPLGNGRQWWPWITLPDHVRAVAHLLDRPEITGPVNLVGPAAATQRDVATAIARAFHRPALLPAPAIALRAALGEFAEDILGSQRATPGVLTRTGFRHEHPTLFTAVDWLTRSR